MKNNFVNSSKPLTEEDIKETEDLLEIKLPKDLKNLYLNSNGGEIEEDKSIFIDSDENDYNIKTFLPIKYKRSEGDQLLEENTIDFVLKKQLIPNGYIIFSIDWGGFPFCYDVNNGAIYFANLEEEDSTHRIILIANSLEEFINGMITEDEAY
ncbi:SMI1/KNR4 family protein [Testudinibacter sp. TR-2022]|uniref:SMI1/KNR4 family protein n=1 Tax=Testudinibacter sp. TR-2022 TaxID=2585029 RepID=UPI0011185F0B|nr:SMI1/KNR4 family protein [Testudinibacter sp. TR-2022]TNH15593.1 SMI1/KNR4 family protein [Testudinibacter sp. TR-2022]